jgi:hypothetical protein
MKKKRTWKVVFVFVAIALAILIPWKVIPMIEERHQCIAEGQEWLEHLREHPVFTPQDSGQAIEMTFRYAQPNDADLMELRETYRLDSVAGPGNELEQIVNLMSWVYSLAKHANEPSIPSERNAKTFIQLALVENRQLNCYMKTVILNEVYLAMGFPSRQTKLLPYDVEDSFSHYVTSVYSSSLDKWIFMDPDFGVYLTDQAGTVLGIREMREHLIAGEPLVTIRPDRSWLADTWEDLDNYLAGVDYSWFLSCFVFKIQCPTQSLYNQASLPVREYYLLIPDGYYTELRGDSLLADGGKKFYYVSDEDAFWCRPQIARGKP